VSKHTPEPWVWEVDERTGEALLLGNDDGPPIVRGQVKERDAPLIAASVKFAARLVKAASWFDRAADLLEEHDPREAELFREDAAEIRVMLKEVGVDAARSPSATATSCNCFQEQERAYVITLTGSDAADREDFEDFLSNNLPGYEGFECGWREMTPAEAAAPDLAGEVAYVANTRAQNILDHLEAGDYEGVRLEAEVE
jgi:hypothetical protein